MLGVAANAGIRALVATRMMRIESSDFHAMIVESSVAGGIIAKSLVRRVGLIRQGYADATLVRVRIVGDRYDFACHEVRDFLLRNQIAFDWLDPSDPADARSLPSTIDATAECPVVLFPDGRVLRKPTLPELARALGLQTQPAQPSYDVVIVGGGPAGLAAAV